MQGKRILILTNRIPYPLNDGGNLAMHAMIKGYHAQGWQVFLLAMNTTRHYITPEVLKTIYTDIAAFETVDIDNGVKPIPTLLNYLFSTKPNHAARFYHTAFANKLEKVITSFQPDAIQVESVFLTDYLPAIRRSTKAITILRLHNIEYQVWQRLAAETKSTLKKTYLFNLAHRIEKYELHAWRQYDLLLPITDTDANVVAHTGTETPMRTIPFGINIAGETTVQNPAQWVGYHIGAMDWLPNAEAMKWFLHDIWPLIHQKIPGFSFYYAGRNMPVYFTQLNIPGTYCMGEVPDAEAFIADKRILFVPLRSGGGIRVKILEAMAMGKIIISTATGMQGIDAVDGVHYLLANDEQAFAAKLHWVLAHKEQAEQIGTAAQRLIREKYNNRQLMQALDNKLAGMLNTLM